MTTYPAFKLDDALDLRARARARAGEADAQAQFNSLFTPADECFPCGKPVGTRISTQLILDPRHKGMVLFVPICPDCSALPEMYLRHRMVKMAKAMWPKSGVWKAHRAPRPKKRA
jgi:hypothetical protein